MSLNTAQFFHGYAVNCHSRHQLDYIGILDGLTSERCIAVPKPTREQATHKARVAALLRELADEATDGAASNRGPIEVQRMVASSPPEPDAG